MMTSRSLQRPRIVFLIENMSYPRDPRIRREASALKRNGCEVSIICPQGQTSDAGSFAIINGIKVYRYWRPWQGHGVLSYLVEYMWAMMCSFALLCWIWAGDGFDALHAANPPDLFCIVALPFLLIGKAFVYDQHDLCPELLDSRLRTMLRVRALVRFFEWLSYKLATLVIVTNCSAYDNALARGVAKERLYVVRNGPELDTCPEEEPRPELRDTRQYMAVYAGSISPQDGVDRVVKAAHHIVYNRQRHDVTFVILGNGDSFKKIQDLANILRVDSYIRFCGWLEGRDFLAHLATADVCLAPEPPEEFNQRSSFIKITDYMRHGKVTVSFDLVESRRTLGASGIFVEHDDPALFGDAILSILDDAVRRQELGALAGTRLRNYFHWGLSSKVLLDAYTKVVWNRRISLGIPAGTIRDMEHEETQPNGVLTVSEQIQSGDSKA